MKIFLIRFFNFWKFSGKHFEYMNKFLTLPILSVICFGAFTSCTSTGNSERMENTSTTVTADQKKSSAFDQKQTENKSVENKTATESAQAKLVEIYDGRKEEKRADVSKEDSDFVKNAIKELDAPVKKYIKNFDIRCEIDTELSYVGEGSFTTPDSSQKIYGYSLCVAGASDVTSGIMIAENGKVSANYLFPSEGGFALKALPDINKNGLSEFAVLTSEGGQGLRNDTLIILEYKEGDTAKYLGWTDAGTVAFNSTSSKETTVKISAEPADKPVFYVETYEKKNDAKDWLLSEKQKRFEISPEAKYSTVFLKVN